MLRRAGMAQTRPAIPPTAMLTSWLNRREQSYATIVYQGDAAPTAWTERCLSQADRVVSGRRRGPPRRNRGRWTSSSHSGSTHHDRARAAAARRDQPAQRDGGLAGPLSRRGAPSRAPGLCCATSDRLARRLSGRSLGLVLGGGGARGFAHMGVFRAHGRGRALSPISWAAPVWARYSAGAYALGLDYDAQMQLAGRLSSPLKLFDPTVPVVSFFASGKVTRRCRKCTATCRSKTSGRPASASPPTSRMPYRWSIAAARCGRPSGRAWRSPASSRRSSTKATCWLTAACSTTCPST